MLKPEAVGCIAVNLQAAQKDDMVYGTAQRHQPNTKERGQVDFKMAMALRHTPMEVKTISATQHIHEHSTKQQKTHRNKLIFINS